MITVEKKLRVALIYLGRKGGGPVYSLEIAKKLQDKSELLTVVSQQVDNFSSWRKNVRQVLAVKTYTNKLEFLFSLFNWPELKRLKASIKEFQPEVIYYPFFHFWLPLINWWFPKIPKVYTAHDPVLHQGENSWLSRFLQDRLIKQSQRVIILSSIFKPVIQAKGQKAEAIDVIPHGIFDYYFQTPSGQLNQMEHSPTLLFFGRVVKYKGLDLLLQAWPLIKKQLATARLLIAGSGDLGPYQEWLKNQQGITVYNQWIDDSQVADFFWQADVLVCPYRDGSQSGAIPVAYAFRLPVVATNIGGLAEQVENQKTGLLVKSGDIKELAEACVKLLQNENLRKQMGEAGYQKAITQWSWEVVSNKALASLEKAAKL